MAFELFAFEVTETVSNTFLTISLFISGNDKHQEEKAAAVETQRRAHSVCLC